VPNNDIFPYVMAVVNRCMSVSMKVVDGHGIPTMFTAEENWAATNDENVREASDRDINHVEEMEKIVESQWDFCKRPRIHPKQTAAEKKVCRSEKGRKHENLKNRSKQKLRKKAKAAARAANIEN
jgi:hypothetical protein